MAPYIKSKNANTHGMTLTELLVASVMIGIVMVGVASFSLAIKNLQRSTDKTVIVALKTKAVMARLTQDAVLAVGDEQDRGVVTRATGQNNSVCFRQDLLNTPDDYTGDTWVCYYRGNTRVLHRCVNPSFSIPPGCASLAQCCNGATLDETLITLADSSGPIGTIVENAAGNLEYIDLILTVRHIYNQPEHPIDNPEYTLSTQVSPQAHSR